jgi:aminopeptidase N
MLRRLVGDEAFFGALRQFYTTWRYKKAGTQDIEAAFQAATPIKLEAFFDLWVRDFRQPRIRLTTESRESGATVRIEQLDQVFVFPLTISIQYMSGRVEERTIKVTDRIVDELVSEPVRRVTTKELLTPFEQVR